MTTIKKIYMCARPESSCTCGEDTEEPVDAAPQQPSYEELLAVEEAAYQKYIRLRDAKSNGYCTGWLIADIIAYDNKILAAAEKLVLARQALGDYYESMNL